MSHLTPAMDAALAAPAVTIFGAASFELESGRLNLLDGSAELSFGGRTYRGLDPDLGALGAVEDLSEGIGNEAPRLSLTLIPANDAAVDVLASDEMQGRLLEIHLGVVIETTGQVVPDPDLIFLGEVDVPSIVIDEDGRTIEIEAASIFERFFADDEGIRLSDAHHRSVFPNELGFAFVTGVQDRVYWGVSAPAGAVTYSGGGTFQR